MRNAEGLNEKQIQEFLEASQGIEFRGESRSEVYGWIQRVLVAQEYALQGKKERGSVRAYLCKMTGLSLPQMTRLIRQYRGEGVVEAVAYRRSRFPVKYTEADMAALAEVDRAHDWLSGPATRCILKREYEEFGKAEYERLAGISVAHLYNLRGSARYRKIAGKWETTRPSGVAIGERRKPEPQGRPGYLRVDTVHQGDWEGVKGVYHINAVDTVTQWQVVGCVSRISEAYVLPVLEAMLHQFPFRIVGFHSDNGSEFINYAVEKLLKSLLIGFTKSRANRTQDNALAEGKNGAIIRKLMGYGHIAGEHAGEIQKFYTAYLNPYLNFNRPCGYARVSVDERGKRRRVYKVEDYATPYQKWKGIAEAEKYLKPNVSFGRLEEWARKWSGRDFAKKMREERVKLLRRCKMESTVVEAE